MTRTGLLTKNSVYVSREHVLAWLSVGFVDCHIGFQFRVQQFDVQYRYHTMQRSVLLLV